jgi:hypothetical protein
MATRSIVTSQPDVACDVCERRLLRGEQPDAFLAAGRRRIVCELCAPRAVQEGWMRETDGQSVDLPALRSRRGRNLFDRLPVPFRVRQAARGVDATIEASASPLAYGEQAVPLAYDVEPAPYDFLESYAPGTTDPVPAHPEGHRLASERPAVALAVDEQYVSGGEESQTGPAALAHDAGLELALEAFNTSEHPRRLAGVARSLGAPSVNVRCSEHSRSVIAIVVAWELCWYRYEVDLDESTPAARVLAQGTELGELSHEDRLANALAVESGTLLLA